MSDPSTELLGIQGNRGSYSEQAAQTLHPNGTIVYCDTFRELFQALRDGRIVRAICPVANKVIGPIPEPTAILAGTEDTFSVMPGLDLPIRHCLLGVPGTTLTDITTIHSQLPALDQCRRYLKTEMPQAKIVEEADTSLSARLVQALQDLTHAAIASQQAGLLCGLIQLATSIQDDPANVTTFVDIQLKHHDQHNHQKDKARDELTVS